MNKRLLAALSAIVLISVIAFCYFIYPTRYKYEAREKVIVIPGQIYQDSDYGKEPFKRKYFRQLHKQTLDASFKVDRLTNETFQLINGRWVLIGLNIPEEYKPKNTEYSFDWLQFEYSDDKANWDKLPKATPGT